MGYYCKSINQLYSAFSLGVIIFFNCIRFSKQKIVSIEHAVLVNVNSSI